MSIIRIPIDVKSLYFNILNDNESGHTATVATPLKQGSSVRPELEKLYGIPESIDSLSRESLMSSIQMSSRAQAKICRVLNFNRVAVNWELLEVPCSFCFYIREETDPGKFHFGRNKLHYPTSLKYSDDTTEINNRVIITAISKQLNDYAFITEAFEYDTDTGVLNFDSTIVGEKDIPYSKVFINQRGAGNKFTTAFSDIANDYDTEIIALRQARGYANVGPDNFKEVYSENHERACSLAMERLNSSGGQKIRYLSKEYPYSLFDIEYSFGNRKHYIIVKQTATNYKAFSLQTNKLQALQDFHNCSELWFFSDIEHTGKLTVYTNDRLSQLTKTITSIRFADKGGIQ